MATRTATVTTNNWNVNAAWVGGVQPTAADDVVIPSGAVITIPTTTTVLARSLTVQAGGRLDWANTATALLSIGDATAGAGNVAISISSTATITPQSGRIFLASTSATQQTVTTGGQLMPIITQNGVGSSYILGSSLNGGVSMVYTLTSGTFNTGNFAMNIGSIDYGNNLARTLTLGSSAITLSATASTFTGSAVTNLTITANTAVVTLPGLVASNNTLFAPGAGNWNGMSVVITGGGVAAIVTNGGTVANLTINGTSSLYDTYRFNGNLTITGTLTIAGTSQANRTYLFSNTPSSARTITAAAVSLSNVDFMDITAAGAASPWTGTALGNALGNTNITFTTAVTRYWIGGAGNTSDMTHWATTSGGTGGATVPMPQDTVIGDINSFTGSNQVLSIDLPRFAKDVTFSNFPNTGNSISVANGNINMYVFGNWTVASTANIFSSGTGGYAFAGRSTHTIGMGGNIIQGTVAINAPGGTYTLIDGLNANGNRSFTHNYGTFDAAGFNLTFYTYTFNSTATFLKMGSGTWNVARTTVATIWTMSMTAGNVQSQTSTIAFIGSSTGTLTFVGGGITYYNLDYTQAGSVGGLTITGANTFNDIRFSDATNARTLIFPSSTTTTFTAVHALTSLFGTSSKLMTVNSSTSGTPATLAFPNGYAGGSDWLSVKDITALTNTWYAGVNSTNVSGNTNVTFTAPPNLANGNFLMFM